MPSVSAAPVPPVDSRGSVRRVAVGDFLSDTRRMPDTPLRLDHSPRRATQPLRAPHVGYPVEPGSSAAAGRPPACFRLRGAPVVRAASAADGGPLTLLTSSTAHRDSGFHGLKMRSALIYKDLSYIDSSYGVSSRRLHRTGAGALAAEKTPGTCCQYGHRRCSRHPRPEAGWQVEAGPGVLRSRGCPLRVQCRDQGRIPRRGDGVVRCRSARVGVAW
jgi:hypothetical protein